MTKILLSSVERLRSGHQLLLTPRQLRFLSLEREAIRFELPLGLRELLRGLLVARLTPCEGGLPGSDRALCLLRGFQLCRHLGSHTLRGLRLPREVLLASEQRSLPFVDLRGGQLHALLETRQFGLLNGDLLPRLRESGLLFGELHAKLLEFPGP